MKKFLILALIICTVSAIGQKSVQNIVSNNSKVVFLGVDFRKAMFMGSTGFSDVDKIQHVYMTDWNLIFIEEFEKYSLQEVLGLSQENYSVSTQKIIKLNETVKIKEQITNEMDYELDEKSIRILAKDYSSTTKEGIGIAYVVEKFDKIREDAVIHVLLIDLSNNEIFFNKAVIVKSSGIGFKNYWSSTFYRIKTDYFSDWYKEWKKSFKKKK
jgi:hypothetical protein